MPYIEINLLMKKNYTTMKELTKEELLNVNGGFWVWLGLTLLVACADSPDDFKQGLKDAAESD